ncbi:hypothetical protein LTR64_002933 [Lithohypha guttulata]|uniref:O-acyltransferase n=1 Tax=Lithohypha guttulata TaxID=1690604 RepID=A0AAN7Y5R7_9EURO|nr:hypothetical protein LTR51_000842 [Lithohypha guttulata]KAK5083953.1 hypothetical protein LTR05_006460 [Lithohypha guttulata]
MTSFYLATTQARNVDEAGTTSLPKQDTNVQVNGTMDSQKKASKFRSKYKHVEALHRAVRPSVLSHDSQEVPSFLGFRNLMVLTIIVMNLRLVIENARKYGLLISVKSNIKNVDLRIGLFLYAVTPCHLLAAYMIERVAMDHAKRAMGLRKKSDAGFNAPETEQERRAFRSTWRWIAFGHALNATLALAITTLVVFYAIENPGIGTISEMHAIVVWLKTCSYAFTNRDLRHAMLHPSPSSVALPDIYRSCSYPNNITLRNLTYFWWAPTLVYQPAYPRTDRIRWLYVGKRLGEAVALSVFMWITCAQYAVPVLHNSLDKMVVLDYPSILERLMKLSTISLIIWLAGFFALFQSFLNMLAELLRFGDRKFYGDWWNSTCLRNYWSTWNKPVYHFMRRHVYSPLVGRGWSHSSASTAVFVFSGFLHELAVGVPTHSLLGVAFLGMVLQLPLIQMTEPLGRSKTVAGKVLGNCIFWINFVFVGQPLAAMIYFFSWQAKYGSLASRYRNVAATG